MKIKRSINVADRAYIDFDMLSSEQIGFWRHDNKKIKVAFEGLDPVFNKKVYLASMRRLPNSVSLILDSLNKEDLPVMFDSHIFKEEIGFSYEKNVYLLYFIDDLSEMDYLQEARKLIKAKLLKVKPVDTL